MTPPPEDSRAAVAPRRGLRAVAPPEDAARIAAAFTASRGAEVLRVDGGGAGGRDCGSLSPHGYRGIEREVVDRVAGWLRNAR